jgi:hypothetical protein
MAIAGGGGGGGGGAPPTIQWTFPNQLSIDQNNGFFTFVARLGATFIGFDLKVNVAPSVQDIIVDWAVNGIVIPAYRTTLPVGDTYVELLVPVVLAPDDELQPIVIQVGGTQPGQTMALRARGS